MPTLDKPSKSRIKRILFALTWVIALLLIGLAAVSYWVYQRQSALLVSGANRVLQPYGIEVLTINGLQTGVQQSRADSVDFRIHGHSAVQRLHSLTLDYEIQTLVQGQFSQLSAESVVLQLEHSALPDGAQLEISNVSISCQSLSQCSGSAALQADVATINSTEPAVRADNITTVSRFNFNYSAPIIRVNIEPGIESKLELLSILNTTPTSSNTALLNIEQLQLRSNQTWRFNLDTEQQLLVFDGGQLHVNAPALRNQPGSDEEGLSGLELNISRVNGSYDYSALVSAVTNTADDTADWMSRLTAQTRLEIRHVYTTLQPYNLWPYLWAVEVSWGATQTLGVDINAVVGGQTIANVQLDQNFYSGQGKLNFSTTNLVFSSSGDSLSKLISPLPLDSDLLEGELQATADIRWQMPTAETSASSDISAWQPQGNIRISASELAGFIDETIFTGLNTTAEWQVRNDLSLVSSDATLLHIQTLDPGLPIDNIETRFHIDSGSGVLALSSLNFQIFGGSVQSDPFEVHLQQTDSPSAFGERFVLSIDDLDISKVLSLSAYNGVSATGLVSGTLPVRLQGLKPVIEGGQLNAKAPGGSIRYDSGNTASGNQSLDLVYQALQHYQYETLSTNVDYTDTGELTLAIQLQGISPELNNGQRINLNLNISDNIPALLQSLQAAQGITDRLEELLE